MSFTSFRRNVSNGINKNADILMTISALIGLGATAYLTYKNASSIKTSIQYTKEDLHEIEVKAHEENWYPEEVKEAKKEAIVRGGKELLPLVLPPTVAFIFTGTMIIRNNVHFRAEKAILTGFVNTANLAAQEFKDAAREHIGEKAVGEIEEKVSYKHLSEAPPVEAGAILLTGHGDKLYSILKRPYDESTRVYFRASPEWVKMATANANEYLACGGSGGSETSYDTYLTYQDYLWFIDKHLSEDYARNWVFIKDVGPAATHRWIKPIPKSHIHPYLEEACCDITFDPGDWQL